MTKKREITPEMARYMKDLIQKTDNGSVPWPVVIRTAVFDALCDADFIRVFKMAGSDHMAVQQIAIDWHERETQGHAKAFKEALLKIGNFECDDEGLPSEQISSGSHSVWVSFSYRNDRWELCAEMAPVMSDTDDIEYAFLTASSVNDDLEDALGKAKALGIEIHWVAS